METKNKINNAKSNAAMFLSINYENVVVCTINYRFYFWSLHLLFPMAKIPCEAAMCKNEKILDHACNANPYFIYS